MNMYVMVTLNLIIKLKFSMATNGSSAITVRPCKVQVKSKQA